jgi:hypothetical protein
LAGRRLEPLPAAAFQLHGSRSHGVAPAPDADDAEDAEADEVAEAAALVGTGAASTTA